ncbi:unnamed protein product [Haemonchus placei]|uniref:Kunitz/Bovine pancreatic trypsin inhibitor domain protein n=1 Tax=Haemonchus placei TaxID=6290 RepID=A0A0N4X530_HAEPC|nr:unnamed protein product [Haemonchus placei]
MFDSGECIEFLFKGCGGNQNRFTSKEDCLQGCRSLTLCGKGLPLMDFAGNIKRCEADRVPCPGSHECIGRGMESVCCQKADRICHTSVHAGSPCGAPPQRRYYYDASSKLCRSFTFTGCGGNENNFKTKGECTQFCSSEVICPRGDPHPDRYSINKIATCHEDKHCPRNYTCTAKIGLKGACCPSRDFVCGSPLNERPNRRSFLKEFVWTFNYRTGECEKREHTAGDEQWNAFASEDQCFDFCVGSCPNGLEQHYNPITGKPQLCDAKAKIGCPIGYECVKTSPFAAICCRTTPVCPAAESIALLEKGQPKRCDPGHHDSCPGQYSCQQADNLEHICCTRPLECPIGMRALRENGGRPRACSLGVQGNCPDDHLCVLGEGTAIGSGARHLCCRPEKVCIVPYVDITKKRPQRCFPGDSVCPLSTSCLPILEENATITNAADVLYFCCHTVDVFTCPDGRMPVMDKNTRKPMRCSRSNPMSCSSDYVCERLIDGSNACCPNPLTEQTCIEAVVSKDNSSIPCKGWDDNSCQEGKCRQAVDGKYYCCRSASDASSDPQFTAMRSELLQTTFRSKFYNDVNRINRAPYVPLISDSKVSFGPASIARRITRPPSRFFENTSTSRRPVPYYLRRLQHLRNAITV